MSEAQKNTLLRPSENKKEDEEEEEEDLKMNKDSLFANNDTLEHSKQKKRATEGEEEAEVKGEEVEKVDDEGDGRNKSKPNSGNDEDEQPELVIDIRKKTAFALSKLLYAQMTVGCSSKECRNAYCATFLSTSRKGKELGATDARPRHHSLRTPWTPEMAALASLQIAAQYALHNGPDYQRALKSMIDDGRLCVTKSETKEVEAVKAIETAEQQQERLDPLEKLDHIVSGKDLLDERVRHVEQLTDQLVNRSSYYFGDDSSEALTVKVKYEKQNLNPRLRELAKLYLNNKRKEVTLDRFECGDDASHALLVRLMSDSAFKTKIAHSTNGESQSLQSDVATSRINSNTSIASTLSNSFYASAAAFGGFLKKVIRSFRQDSDNSVSLPPYDPTGSTRLDSASNESASAQHLTKPENSTFVAMQIAWIAQRFGSNFTREEFDFMQSKLTPQQFDSLLIIFIEKSCSSLTSFGNMVNIPAKNNNLQLPNMLPMRMLYKYAGSRPFHDPLRVFLTKNVINVLLAMDKRAPTMHLHLNNPELERLIGQHLSRPRLSLRFTSKELSALLVIMDSPIPFDLLSTGTVMYMKLLCRIINSLDESTCSHLIMLLPLVDLESFKEMIARFDAHLTMQLVALSPCNQTEVLSDGVFDACKVLSLLHKASRLYPRRSSTVLYRSQPLPEYVLKLGRGEEKSRVKISETPKDFVSVVNEAQSEASGTKVMTKEENGLESNEVTNKEVEKIDEKNLINEAVNSEVSSAATIIKVGETAIINQDVSEISVDEVKIENAIGVNDGQEPSQEHQSAMPSESIPKLVISSPESISAEVLTEVSVTSIAELETASAELKKQVDTLISDGKTSSLPVSDVIDATDAEERHQVPTENRSAQNSSTNERKWVLFESDAPKVPDSYFVNVAAVLLIDYQYQLLRWQPGLQDVGSLPFSLETLKQIMVRKPSSPNSSNSLLHYPFLLEVRCKGKLFHYMTLLKMTQPFRTSFIRSTWLFQLQKLAPDSAADASNRYAFATTRCDASPYLVLEIRREHLVADALFQIKARKKDLRKPLRVRFVMSGEEGVDMGGVQKEFLQAVVDELCDPKMGLFLYDADARIASINPVSMPNNIEYKRVFAGTSSSANSNDDGFTEVEADTRDLKEPSTISSATKISASASKTSSNPPKPSAEDLYELFGIILGLAMYNGIILHLSIPTRYITRIVTSGLNSSVDSLSLDDLRQANPTVASSFEQLLSTNDDVEDFCLTFEISQKIGSEVITANLKPGGDGVVVTKDNRNEFVARYIHHLFVKSIDVQMKTIIRGFYSVCTSLITILFSPDEAVKVLIGSSENLDMSKLIASTSYDGFDAGNNAVLWFWEVVTQDLSKEEQRKLLAFITGNDRVPLGGLSAIPLTIQRNGGDSEHLPAAMTCFNRLLLPEYESKEKLCQKLKIAINNAHGFGLV